MGAIFARTVGDYQVIDATIAASAATSDIVDLGNHNYLAICMPTSWTAAALAFLASSEVDGTYNPVVGATGAELAVSATIDVVIQLDDLLTPLRFVKIVSGTTGSPVEQDEERVVKVLVK